MIYSSSVARRDHRVVLLKCDRYEDAQKKLIEGINLLGGIHQFVTQDEHIVLKPNLLLGDKPERGSTTNPEFFKAVASLLIAEGYHVSYGDSPGFGSPLGAVRASGLFGIAETLGIELADFVGEQEVSYPEGILLKQFLVAKGVIEADAIINLPKFKTHALTRLTGSVKNLFGCLPGVQKAAFHARLSDETRFGEMLVDLAELISPRLHIMDGVLGMEGNGPRNGSLREVGLILISPNPHALDHCVAKLMDLDPDLVPTLQAAKKYDRYQPEKIEVLGEPIEGLVMPDYDVNRSRIRTTGPQAFYMDVFKNWVTPRPVIDEGKCTHCGRCVTVCPANPKAIGFLNGRKESPQYDYQKCIRCYCCQEMCPDEAIAIETPLIGRIFNKINL